MLMLRFQSSDWSNISGPKHWLVPMCQKDVESTARGGMIARERQGMRPGVILGHLLRIRKC